MSVPPSELLEAGLAKIDADLTFLMDCLREVLVELGEGHLARFVPWTNQGQEPEAAANLPNAHDPLPARLGQVYATAFQLLNLIEENVSAQVRRQREKIAGPASEPGLWGANLHRLRHSGLDANAIAAGLASVVVEPVLTAHPTEAKRPTALEQHRRLFHLLQRREDPRQTPLEQADGREEIKLTLERLWRTGEILLRKPEVAAERRNLMYYFTEVFPRALPELDRRLRQAWTDTGFDAALLGGGRHWPRLRFGTWVGGDRDGHPLVTAETTRETLSELRAGGLLVLARQLARLASRLCLSHNVQSPPASFSTHLSRLMEAAGERGQAILHDSPEEPWKQYVRLLLLKLPSGSDVSPRAGQTYARAAELTADLERLNASLVEVGAGRIATRDVLPVLRAVDAFGFHLATLDVRQNSRFHDQALGQLLTAAGHPGQEFAGWDEPRRLAFIEAELRSSRPFAHSGASAGPEADAVLSCYRLLVHQHDTYGAGGLGTLIVSMTRQLSDLLVVYLLAREAGLARSTPGGLVCLLPVTPLFETAEDLEGAPAIMRDFLAHPVTVRSLHALRETPDALPVQQIMIGYSDSNKESGILASQWALHRAQTTLTALGRETGFRIRFFHGRGGTISRGAGPTHRFLDALPPGSVGGDLRLTEQGETIAQKYGNTLTANFNLELLLAGTAGTSLRPASAATSAVAAAMEGSVNRLVATSREVYEGLLKEPDFMTFYSQATPIDALEQSSIGSRPSRRTGQRTLADLRAIPWVFSWNQARFYLPGWYGVGSALAHLRAVDAGGFENLKACVNGGWPFLRYVLMNVETNLASADRDIMSDYAALVPEAEIRRAFLDRIQAEFTRTHDLLTECFGRSTMDRRPRAAKTLRLRADALHVLHRQQIELLARWRGLQGAGDEAAARKMLPELLLSINAIASGLRTTG